MATLYHLLWVFLLASDLSVFASKQPCPTACHCNVLQPEYSLTCENVPEAIPEAVTSLTISRSSSPLVNAFSNLPSLRHLTCKHCQMRILDEDTFRNSYNLETIDLSSNTLTHVPLRAFSHLDKLYMLNLSENIGLDCDAVLSEFVEVPQVEVICGSSIRHPRSLGNNENKTTSNVEDRPYYQLPCFNRPRSRRDAADEPCLNESRIAREVNLTSKTDQGNVSSKTDQDNVTSNQLDVEPPLIHSSTAETDDGGWGVGTFVVLAILIVIIALICFKFVFQRLRKRCKKSSQRPSEEEPLEEHHA